MRTVYVLGAGASRFAGFPLGKDLLPFLKSERKNTREIVVGDLGRHALDFIDKVRSALPQRRILRNGEPDLEFVLSLIDRIGQNRYFEGPEHACLLDDLDAVISDLDLATWDLAPIKRGFIALVASAFQYHSYELLRPSRDLSRENFLVTSSAWTNRVSPGDTLITFNWDLVQEILLWKVKKWSYQDGYGIQTTLEKPLSPSKTTILKLHGSCNWALRHEQDASLRVDHADVFFDEVGAGSQDPAPLGSTSDYGTSLIVPSYLKDPSRVTVLRSVWERAYEELKEAKNLVVLGYSLPNADFFVQRLFREAIGKNRSLNSIVLVVGTDDEAFGRWQALCENSQKDCTRVRQTLEEYATTPH